MHAPEGAADRLTAMRITALAGGVGGARFLRVASAPTSTAPPTSRTPR